MKIAIQGQPRFELRGLELDTVRLLILLAVNHYDGTCRAAGQPGGFLFGWQNILQYAAAQDVAQNHAVTATFRELDLTLKLCEERHRALGLVPDGGLRIEQYVAAVTKALERSNKFDYSQWRIEV